MPDAARERFILEVYEPDSSDDVTATFKSDAPFQAVAVGDLVNLTTSGGQLLEVTRVEHILWDASGVMKHKVLIFTKTAPDTRESRLTRSHDR